MLYILNFELMISCCVHILLGLPYSPCNMVLHFIYEVNVACSNYSFDNCVLCFNYMPDRVLGARDSAVNQISWLCAKRWMYRKCY